MTSPKGYPLTDTPIDNEPICVTVTIDLVMATHLISKALHEGVGVNTIIRSLIVEDMLGPDEPTPPEPQ